MRIPVVFGDNPAAVSVSLRGDSTSIAGTFSDVQTLTKYEPYDPYEGTYTVTPTQETQTLLTANLRMLENVTINPIPSNYGLITWNGSTLTVS